MVTRDGRYWSHWVADRDENESFSVWQYFSVADSSKANAICMYCNGEGCSFMWPAEHILECPVLGQRKAGIRACIATYQ